MPDQAYQKQEIIIPFPDSKLSPQLQEAVRTEGFKSWFGYWENFPYCDNVSKIVDPDTHEPKLFYHGTTRQFESFAHPKDLKGFSNTGIDIDQSGIFVTDSIEMAITYADPIGADFAATISWFAHKYDCGTYSEAISTWNELALGCQIQDDLVVTVEESEKIYTLDALPDAIESGEINYASFLLFKDKKMLLGEAMQLFGGQLPGPEDELVDYVSIYPGVEEIFGQLPQRLLIPERSKPRIIPVFVKSITPLVQETASSGLEAMDNAFAKGLSVASNEPAAGYDSIYVDCSELSFGLDYAGVNILIPNPAEQLLVASNPTEVKRSTNLDKRSLLS